MKRRGFLTRLVLGTLAAPTLVETVSKPSVPTSNYIAMVDPSGFRNQVQIIRDTYSIDQQGITVKSSIHFNSDWFKRSYVIECKEQ